MKPSLFVVSVNGLWVISAAGLVYGSYTASNCDDFEKYLHERDDFTTQKGKWSSNHCHGRTYLNFLGKKSMLQVAMRFVIFCCFHGPPNYPHQNYLRQTYRRPDYKGFIRQHCPLPRPYWILVSGGQWVFRRAVMLSCFTITAASGSPFEDFQAFDLRRENVFLRCGKTLQRFFSEVFR